MKYFFLKASCWSCILFLGAAAVNAANTDESSCKPNSEDTQYLKEFMPDTFEDLSVEPGVFEKMLLVASHRHHPKFIKRALTCGAGVNFVARKTIHSSAFGGNIEVCYSALNEAIGQGDYLQSAGIEQFLETLQLLTSKGSSLNHRCTNHIYYDFDALTQFLWYSPYRRIRENVGSEVAVSLSAQVLKILLKNTDDVTAPAEVEPKYIEYHSRWYPGLPISPPTALDSWLSSEMSGSTELREEFMPLFLSKIKNPKALRHMDRLANDLIPTVFEKVNSYEKSKQYFSNVPILRKLVEIYPDIRTIEYPDDPSRVSPPPVYRILGEHMHVRESEVIHQLASNEPIYRERSNPDYTSEVLSRYLLELQSMIKSLEE